MQRLVKARAGRSKRGRHLQNLTAISDHDRHEASFGNPTRQRRSGPVVAKKKSLLMNPLILGNPLERMNGLAKHHQTLVPSHGS